MQQLQAHSHMYVHYNFFYVISAQRLPTQHTAHSHLIHTGGQGAVASAATRSGVEAWKDALEPPCQAQQISALPPPFLGGEKAQN